MRLTGRIALFVTLTSVVPLSLMAGIGGRVAREGLSVALERQQIASAEQLAASLSQQLDDIDRVLLAQVTGFNLDVAPDEVRAAFVVASYQLFPEIAVAALVDAGGADAAGPVYAQSEAEAAGHDVVDAERYARFRSALPSAPAAVARGVPYTPDRAEHAVLPVVYSAGDAGGLKLAVELSLARLRRQLAVVAGEDRAALLVDSDGEVLLAAGLSPLVDPTLLRAVLRSPAASARVDDEVLVATAQLRQRDLVAVVAAKTDSAERMVWTFFERTAYIFAVAMVVALVGGTILWRLITQPVQQLRDAAQDVGGGNLSRRVGLEPGDELGELGQSFDTMTAALEANRDEIAAKNRDLEASRDEISAKNAELRDINATLDRKVEERSAQLVQSRQLAAVAEMSAGLAHELNNPLAGILGLLQVVKQMRAGSPDAALLGSAEEQALRCKDIVAKLLRFTGGTGAGGRERVNLAGLVRDLVSLSEATFRQREVAIRLLAGESELSVMADPEELGRALSQVFTALRTVAEAGSTLSVYLGRREGRAEVTLQLDQVRGSEDDWRANALGLWAARQVFDLHQARLDDAPVERGRAWRFSTPLAPGAGRA